MLLFTVSGWVNRHQQNTFAYLVEENRVLKENGIQPAPDRPTGWRTFIQAQWGEVVGADFFTTEVWIPQGS